MKFEKFNINPKGMKASDCVIRAIAFATEQTWDQVYKDLCEIGFKLKRIPNEKKVYEKYLEKIGWTKNKQPRDYMNKKLTVDEFSKQFNRVLKERDSKRIIITVANHMTAIEWTGYEMQLIDTWNCSHKSVGNYWTKEN